MYIIRHNWSRMFLHAHPTCHKSFQLSTTASLRHSCPHWRETPISRGSNRLAGLPIILPILRLWDSNNSLLRPESCTLDRVSNRSGYRVDTQPSFISQKARFWVQIYHCPTHVGAVVTDNGLRITVKRHRVPTMFDPVINI